jgi:AcrR family transcriptional regulator
MARDVSVRVGTLTVHRALTSAQRDRRRRIVEAAMELAAQGGYEAVVVKDVAARARVSLGTLYRYFSSKDHLLAEALAVWGGRLGERLQASPPAGATAAARVAAVFHRMARGVELEPALGVALTRALLSPDPSALANRDELAAMMRGWIELALGDAPVRDREGVVFVLEHLCFACMITLAGGQRTPREIGDQLERAARLLLD